MNTCRCCAVVLSVMVALVAVEPIASAAAGDKARARVLFKEGNKLLNKKHYDGALAKFREAAKLFSSYKIDLNIATTLTSMGKLAEAAQFYDRFLRRGSQSAPAGILAGARSKLDELKAKVATVKIVSEVAGARVTLNAKPIGETPIAHELYVMPGPCQFAASKEGHQRFLETLSLAPGQVKQLELVLPEDKVAAPPEPTPPPEPVAPPVDAPSDSGSWKKTAGWITLAAGGASLVTGAIFGGLTAAKASEHADAVEDRADHEVEQGLADDHGRLQTISVVTLVIGGVAAAAGGGLLLWHYLGGKGQGSAEHAATTHVLVPVATGDTVGASYTIRF